MKLLDRTVDMNHDQARATLEAFQQDTDARINKVIFKVNKLHNLKDKLNGIDKASKRTYTSANIKRAPAVAD